MSSPDVVVIGAGAVGAACAYFAARAGLRVRVLERGQIAGGTSSACEGNLLVSDKEAGPELDLALHSQRVWREDLAEFGPLWEFESKGGLVVSGSPSGAAALSALTVRQRAAGIQVSNVDPADIADYEPHLRPGLAGAAFYPQDAQVQPMLLTAHLLRLARELGAVVSTGAEVTGFEVSGDQVCGVRTGGGPIAAGHVINAAGTWAGEIAALAGVPLPVLPRRGFVLVTEPQPPRMVRHKVYAADYVAAVASSDQALQTSPVIEGTPSGTVLIGSSRERVGFDARVSLPVLSRLAQEAIALFPVLAGVRVLRSYHGFRPYCPDHLPVIGADPGVPGLWHATGHEGAGIGLSVGTAKLLVQELLGVPTDLDLAPFSPARFAPDRSSQQDVHALA